jgi:hypothetical protein
VNEVTVARADSRTAWRVRVAVVHVSPPSESPPPQRIRRARRRVVAFLVAVVAATAGFGVAADTFAPTLRDPEYGKKLTRLKARLAASPGRPLVVVLGSSRVALGVRPPAVEAGFDPDHRPVVANLSLLGSGPLLQLLAYHRLRHDGIKPDAVVVEYWPVLARAGDADREENRIDPVRLFPSDRPIVRDFFRDPAAVDGSLLRSRWNPFTASRARIISLTVPTWLPAANRADPGWASLDADGWSPGLPDPDPTVDRGLYFAACGPWYASRLADTAVSPDADRAFRTLLDRCRADGVAVAFAWLPESSRFRGLYSPKTEAAATAYWTDLTRTVPGFDLRRSMPDALLPDGFHLTRTGAADFGPVLAAGLKRAFPDLLGKE